MAVSYVVCDISSVVLCCLWVVSAYNVPLLVSSKNRRVEDRRQIRYVIPFTVSNPYFFRVKFRKLILLSDASVFLEAFVTAV